MPPCLDEKSTESQVLEALRQNFPSRGFAEVRLNRNGWENLVAEVDDAWIVRFPKLQTQKIERERQILKALAGKTRVAIPDLELWGEKVPCMGYRKLPGEHWQQYDALNQAQIDQLGEDLAAFMIDLQAGMNRAAWDACGLKAGWSAADMAWMEERLAGLGEAQTMRRFHDSRRYVAELEAKAPQGLVHRDLHSGNYLLDPASQRLCAVFDFGDADFGDVHRDFTNLTSRPFLCQAAVSAYQRFSGHKLDPQLLRAHAWLYYLWMLADVAQQPDSSQHHLARQRLATLETSK